MVKERKIRKVFEEIYQEQLAKHSRGETIQNLCRVIKTYCVLNGYSALWIEIQQWFKPERYGLTELYYTIDVNIPTPIEMIPYEDRDRYYWYPVHREYNLKRLEILEMEIDNQLKEEGYGEG